MTCLGRLLHLSERLRNNTIRQFNHKQQQANFNNQGNQGFPQSQGVAESPTAASQVLQLHASTVAHMQWPHASSWDMFVDGLHAAVLAATP